MVVCQSYHCRVCLKDLLDKIRHHSWNLVILCVSENITRQLESFLYHVGTFVRVHRGVAGGRSMILSSSGIMEVASVDAWMDAGVLIKRPKEVFLDWKDYSSWLMSNYQIGRCTWFCQHTGMPTKTPRMSFRIIPGVMYDLLSDGGFIPNRRYVKWAFRARNGSFGRPSPCHSFVGCCKHPFHEGLGWSLFMTFSFYLCRYWYKLYLGSWEKDRTGGS